MVRPGCARRGQAARRKARQVFHLKGLVVFDMDVRPLFQKAHRNSDPPTSALAAEDVTSSGKRLSQCRRIVTVLVSHGIDKPVEALTFTEIACLLDWPHDHVHKRMKDCRRCGPWVVDGALYRVLVGGARTCAKRRTVCSTYYVERMNGALQ